MVRMERGFWQVSGSPFLFLNYCFDFKIFSIVLYQSNKNIPMKNEPDFFQIALSFFAVIGFILLIRMFFIWFFKLKEDTKILSSPIKVMDDFEEEFLLKGYIFCTLFKVTDIIIIARKMNIALTMDQVRLVIISVRKDFDINTGIDAHRISMHIRMVVKQQLARQKPV